MDLLQILETAVTDIEEFVAGEPVTITVGTPWDFNNGIKFDLTSGNADLTIPNGEVFAIPISNTTLSLPSGQAVTVSAIPRGFTVQKAS